MLFKRRETADLLDRARTFMWPRRSFTRSARYFSKRVLRLTATPHAIAAGLAAGAVASFTPYMGFHFIIAGLLAWLIRGNLIASALGTAIGNPITFPLIWAATLATGRLVLYGGYSEEVMSLQIGNMLTQLDLGEIWYPVLLPMTVGGLILGTICGGMLYLIARVTVGVFRRQRQERLNERRARSAAIRFSPLRGIGERTG